MKLYPYERGGGGGGGGSVVAMLNGGHNKFNFWVVFMWCLEVVARLKWGGGGAKSFHPVMGGGGGGVTPSQKVSDPRFSHFTARPPSP